MSAATPAQMTPTDLWIAEVLLPQLAPTKEPYFTTRAVEEAKAIIAAGAVIPNSWSAFCAMVRIWFASPENNTAERRVQCTLLLDAIRDGLDIATRNETTIVLPGSPGSHIMKWLARKNLPPTDGAIALNMPIEHLYDLIHGRRPFPLDQLHHWAVVLGLDHQDRLEMISTAINTWNPRQSPA